MLAIQNGVPKILSLRQILGAYIEHPERSSGLDGPSLIKKSGKHVPISLEGLFIALDHIDEVIRIIRNSQTDAETS